ncbi:hypothetical protein KCP78_10300 [Salmonella enterica subsp. enterica]|nr:hypothetical protein KCP78_10300 [Salmonella enterica subsp. enterica]
MIKAETMSVRHADFVPALLSSVSCFNISAFDRRSAYLNPPRYGASSPSRRRPGPRDLRYGAG